MKIEIENVTVYPQESTQSYDGDLIMKDKDGLLEIELSGGKGDNVTIVLVKGEVEQLRDSLNMFLEHTRLSVIDARKMID